MNAHTKQRIAVRYWLQGAGYHQALEAMTFAEDYHRGTRKDGITPEFSHQIGVACLVRCHIPHLRHPQESITVAFLHDVSEDYDVPNEVIRSLFGGMVADSVGMMTKEFRGVRRDPAEVFDAIAADPIASVDKLMDRVNNQGSMVGVFTPEKMDEYIDETRRYFLPMLKQARRSFPDQEPVYEMAKLLLTSQLNLLDALLAERGV